MSIVEGAGTPRLRALLEQVSLVVLDADRALLAPRPEVRRLLEQRLPEVEQHVSKVLGRQVRCGLEGAGADVTPATAGADRPAGAGDERARGNAGESGADSVHVVMNHPLVRRAMEVFNARVVRVEQTERTVRNDGE